MAAPASSARPAAREPTYFEHPLDDTVHYHEFRPRPKPGLPAPLVATAVILLVVLAAAFLYSIRGGLHGVFPSSSGVETIVPDGAQWPMSPQQYWVQQFEASAVNGTLFGNFTSSGQETDVLLLNETQMDNFTGNVSDAETYATGPVRVGGMAWIIGPPGTYFLIGLNEEVTPVTLTWVTPVQYVP
jgi:hypothetical protein